MSSLAFHIPGHVCSSAREAALIFHFLFRWYSGRGIFPDGHLSFMFLHHVKYSWEWGGIISRLFSPKYSGGSLQISRFPNNASVVRWHFRDSLSASGGSCDISSSGYWSFGASRTYLHGILVMAWVESKVAKLAAFC